MSETKMDRLGRWLFFTLLLVDVVLLLLIGARILNRVQS